MRILLTGSAGFLGAAIGRAIRATFPGAEVSGADRRATPSTDLLDPAQVAALVDRAKPTHVIHAAGGHGQLDVRQQFELHAVATEHLLKALRAQAGAPVFINVGSAAQYGPQRERRPLGEDARDEPAGPYGVSKVAAELLVRANANSGALRAVYLRVFNPIGPEQQGGLLVPTIVRQLAQAQAGRAEVVLANLDDERDYLDADDVGRAVVACLGSERALGQQLNVCSGSPTSVRDIALGLARAAGLEATLSVIPGPPREASYSCGDPEKLQRLAGFRPTIPLALSLERICAAAGLTRRQ